MSSEDQNDNFINKKRRNKVLNESQSQFTIEVQKSQLSKEPSNKNPRLTEDVDPGFMNRATKSPVSFGNQKQSSQGAKKKPSKKSE